MLEKRASLSTSVIISVNFLFIVLELLHFVRDIS